MLKTINNEHKEKAKKNKFRKYNILICIIIIGITGLFLNLSGNTLQCYAEEGGYIEDGGGDFAGESSGDSGGESSGESSGGTSSSGYTPEQIAAAKAWLSAHGYSPTRAGASQAYQDYLDGKLDNDPDVRKYKGLDKTDSSSDNSSGKTNTGKPAGENDSDGTSENSSEATGSGQSNKTDKADASDLQSGTGDVADVNFDDMTNIIDEEVDPKQELEDRIESSKSQLKLQSDDSEVTLIYDDYEETEEEAEKKKNSSKALMYLVISFIFLVIFLSLFKLLKSDKEF